MAAILRITGWLAIAVGVIFVILPMFTATGLSVDATVSSGILLIIAGPMLIGLAKLIEVAEKIQANTNWLSTRGTPAAQAAVEAAKPVEKRVEKPVERVAEPERAPVPIPAPAPVPFAESLPEPPVEHRPAPMQAASRALPPAPELYDASMHPAAIDEWSQHDRRIMTLEDGTYATEVDGAWYRFLELKDIEVLP